MRKLGHAAPWRDASQGTKPQLTPAAATRPKRRETPPDGHRAESTCHFANTPKDTCSAHDHATLEAFRQLCSSPKYSPTCLAHAWKGGTHAFPVWYEFLSSYGVANDVMLKVACEFPELFTGDIYTAGEAILFFKSYGWKDRDIRQRIVAQWPHLLTKSVSRDFVPVVEHLEEAGCRGEHLRLLLWEYPRIFISRDFRRQTSKFARLGVYGLSPDYLQRSSSLAVSKFGHFPGME